MIPLRAAAFAALAALSAPGGRAEDGRALPPLAAVGQITQGRSAPDAPGTVCTGVLVAPDLVLTAAHCAGRQGGDGRRQLHFAAGRNGTRALALRRGVDVEFPEAGRGRPGTWNDVALVTLDAPVPPEAARPLPLAPRAGRPAVFAFIGYRRDDRAARPEVTLGCRPLAAPPGLIALDCPVSAGNSGAPVLGLAGGEWAVFGILTASVASGGARSLAAVPPEEFRAAVAARLGGGG